MAFDENGERLTPTHAVKKGTRYRYYVSASLVTGTVKDGSNGRRIPAANLETLVITRLKTFLADRGALLDAIQYQCPDAVEQIRLIRRARRIADELGTLAPDQTRAILIALLSRVDVRSDRVDIRICQRRLAELLAAQATNLPLKTNDDPTDVLTLTVMARLQRVGCEMRMLVENSEDQTTADPGLLRIVARAHDIPGTPDAEHRPVCACYRESGTSIRSLRLSPAASSLACTRHHHRHYQREEPIAAYRQEADATDNADTDRLGGTTETTWLPRALKWLPPSARRPQFPRRLDRLTQPKK